MAECEAPITTWVDPDGTEYTLPSGAPIEGCGLPPIRVAALEVFDEPGARLLDSSRHAVRELFVPIGLQDDSTSAHLSSLRAWAARLDPQAGQGKFRRTLGTDAREANALYVGGYEWREQSHVVQIAGLRFHCFDPYWYDVSERSVEFTTGELATFFPFFPLRLSSSEVFADTSINNDGSVKAWPIWEILGPGTDPVLRDQTNGKRLELNVTLAAGETLTIDTRPGVKTVVDDAGDNRYDLLVDGSAFWPLEKGVTAVRIEMSGATDDSRVSLRYRRRHLSA